MTLRRFASAALLLTTAVGTAGWAGLRVNTTHSIPPGVYWLTDLPVTPGDTVLACPPELPVIAEAFQRGYIGVGFCPGGYEYLFKRALAAKNDVVSIEPSGVSVNGSSIPNTAQMSADPAGRRLPIYSKIGFRLSENDVLLISNYSPRSFDGRYFGPVDSSLIRGVVIPLVTW
ncbi:conjugative transfer signal peptidase TraF [Methyloterricola oryzae]|uniref:conjugative transfer signal peptidase TraF n=1 Tax=Methyloterricola oryzae TaxID=1495050 RepID=UPI0009E1D194|nr:conjugative transfer signal peptidase TraF [Methyloterricola oryzae]